METTKSFIGKSTQKKRKRVDPIPIVPMSAALVRTPTMKPTVPADPDYSTEEYDFDSEVNVTPKRIFDYVQPTIINTVLSINFIFVEH